MTRPAGSVALCETNMVLWQADTALVAGCGDLGGGTDWLTSEQHELDGVTRRDGQLCDSVDIVLAGAD